MQVMLISLPVKKEKNSTFLQTKIFPLVLWTWFQLIL